ncbi:MAG: hypothetical protein IKC79_01105 [Clostridia bacterium]|nr:hypothetical protein [Clostridia bacterium]
MWEYTIKCDKHSNEYLHYIYNNIVSRIIDKGGNIAIVENDTECILSVAVSDTDTKTMQRLIKTKIVDILCEKMKYDYIKNRWAGGVFHKDFEELFLRVCTYFDIELERKIVMRNLVLSNSIMLDTYIHFYLSPLIQKWQDLVNLVNNNVDVFLQNDTFFEILSFLVSNLDTKTNIVNISISDDSSSLVLECGKLYKIFDINDTIGIITGLIEFAPKKVLIAVPQHSHYSMDRIVQLFGNRVDLIAGK